MTKIIAIANQKGGVGKTTTALCIGAELESKGYKVLYIDLDKQCNTSNVLKANTTKRGTYDIIVNGVKAEDIIQVTANEQYVISASANLGAIDKVISNQIGKEYRLKESLNNLPYFDFVILDTAPHLDTLTANALTCTDYLVIVANADMFSLDGVKDLQISIKATKQYTNPNIKVGGILINRYNPRANLNQALKQALEELAKEYETKVYKTYIRENIAIKESQTLKERITTYAPKSNGNIDYLAVTEEILEDLGK